MQRFSYSEAELHSQIITLEKENAELKRLLSLAVKDFDRISSNIITYTQSPKFCDYSMSRANPYDNCNGCPLANSAYKNCKWKNHDEAIELIGGDENT